MTTVLIPAALLDILRIEPSGDWRDSALCAQTDPDAFYPENGGSTRAAKRICADCPVQNECLLDALDRGEEFGVWGGLSRAERRRLKKQVAA